MNRSVNHIVEKKLCIGCGACFSVCPASAIKIFYDPGLGSYIPKIDKRKCTNCGICKKICPSLNSNIENHSLKQGYGYYITRSLDETIYKNSSSGGTVTSLLIHLFRNDLIDAALLVKGGKYKKPYSFIAYNEEEVLSCMGSKYCPVPILEKLKCLIDSDNKTFAVVGLPCQIQAIENIRKVTHNLKDKTIIYLGLFCSRMPSFHATNYFFSKFLNKNSTDVISINYRKGHDAEVILKDGGTVDIPYKKYWNSDFKYLFHKRCLFCYDRVNELAHVSFGDYWSGKRNIVIVRDNKINEILNNAEDIEVKRCSYEKAKSYLINPINFKKNLLDAKLKILHEKNIPNDRIRTSRFSDYVSALTFIIKYKIVNFRNKRIC